MTTYGVKYIGSKASLISEIIGFVNENVDPALPKTFIDVFTGTTRVSQAFRAAGWTVTSSDLSWAAEVYANAFLIRTAESGARIPSLIERLCAIPPLPDWITKTYCDVVTPEGGIVKMWKPNNGSKADAMRNQISLWEKAKIITKHESMILIACLIFALDKVDSSVGVQQAYLKEWASRANNLLKLEDLPFPTGPVGTHLVGDALTLEYTSATVAYLDPPYSSHSYSTYYHIWDSITRWDKPEVGLKTNRRIDRVSSSDQYDESMSSAWNSKPKALKAFVDLVDRIPARFVVVSYNDESIVPLDALENAFKAKYEVKIKKIPYKRNIMAQIGNAADNDKEKKTTNHEVLIWIKK